MDYNVFVSGFGFILLAITTLQLSWDKKANYPWRWLVLFGLLAAVREWTFSNVFYEHIPFGINIGFGWITFVILAEFLRRIWIKNTKISVNPSIYAGFLIVFILSLFEQQIALFVVYILLPILLFLCAAFVAFYFFRNRNTSSRFFGLVPALIILFGVSNTLYAISRGDISFLIEYNLAIEIGQPYFLTFHASIIYGIVFGLWIEMAKANSRIGKAHLFLRTRQIIALAGISLFVILFGGGIVVQFLEDAATRQVANTNNRLQSEFSDKLQTYLQSVNIVSTQIFNSSDLLNSRISRMNKPIEIKDGFFHISKALLNSAELFLFDISQTDPLADLLKEKNSKLASYPGNRLFLNEILEQKESQLIDFDVNTGQPILFVGKLFEHEQDKRKFALVVEQYLDNIISVDSDGRSPVFIISPTGITSIERDHQFFYRSVWPVISREQEYIQEQNPYLKIDDTFLVDKPFTSDEIAVYRGKEYLANLNALHGFEWKVLILGDLSQYFTYRVFAVIIIFVLAILAIVLILALERAHKITALTANSEKQFRTIFEIGPQSVLLVNPQNYIVIEMNSQMEKMLGYSRKLLIGKPLENLFVDRFDKLKTRFSQLNELGTILLRNYQLYTQKSGIIDIDGTGSLIEFQNDVSIILFLQNVTDKKRDEDMILQSEKKYRKLFDTASDAIILIDDGLIFDCNSRAQEIYDLKRSELIGKNPEILLPVVQSSGSTSKQIFNYNLELTMKGEPQRFSLENIRGVDDLFEAEISLSKVEVKGKWMVQAMIRDVTEQKMVEKHLKEARDKALDASRLKSEFLANMSHEIRTPMNGVLGMIDLLGSTKLTNEQHELLETAKSSADSLLKVINDVLDFSKIEAGKLDLEHIAFDMRHLIEGVSETMAKQAYDKGIELISIVDNAVPQAIKGAPSRLRQILINLSNNAIKFTESGEVVISCDVIEQDKKYAWLRLCIKDTGIGIPKEKQNHIFEAFRQADGSTTRVYGGTGLGLAISQQLVDLMKGRIRLYSEENRGSKFEIDIPFEIAIDENSVSKKELAFLQDKRILIVEENETNRKIFLNLLEGAEITLKQASSGREAQHAIDKSHQDNQTFDLIILDILLNDMPGFDLAKKIRKDKRNDRTKIIALASLGDLPETKKLFEMGFNHHITKPIKTLKALSALEETFIENGIKEDGGEAEEDGPDKHNIQSDDETIKILLAEDNLINQKVAVRIVESGGYKIDVVDNGKEAVQRLRQKNYDLVLMDVQMPVMDGYEATNLIRASEKSSKHIPIIALTAHAMKGDREKCIEAGMDDYVTKPIKKDILFSKIKSFVSSDVIE